MTVQEKLRIATEALKAVYTYCDRAPHNDMSYAAAVGRSQGATEFALLSIGLEPWLEEQESKKHGGVIDSEKTP